MQLTSAAILEPVSRKRGAWLPAPIMEGGVARKLAGKGYSGRKWWLGQICRRWKVLGMFFLVGTFVGTIFVYQETICNINRLQSYSSPVRSAIIHSVLLSAAGVRENR
jgi:hypothetical protein